MSPEVPQSAAGKPRPLRKDAQENRDRIVAAARQVFAERGLEATLHDVADRAGVGVGTVYRRFRNKDEVLEAIFDQQIEQVRVIAQQALDHEDPWLGFEQFFLRMTQQFSIDRGLREVVLSGSPGRRAARQTDGRLGPVFASIMKRAQDAGVLRPGLEPSDLPPISQMLSAVIDYTGKVNPEVWRRYAMIFLDGLRPQPDSEQILPAAMTNEEIQAVLGFRPDAGPEPGHDGSIAASGKRAPKGG
jgi:AcrR family transcriptional regulator